MNEFIVWVLAAVALILAVEFFFLRGANLATYDKPIDPPRGNKTPGAEHGEVVASLGEIANLLKGVPRSGHLAMLRNYMDTGFPPVGTSASFTPVQADSVPAEWVVAPGVDGRRRLLYIHGGAYTMGSPKSHRRISSKFSEVANAAVLAIDYRLMPEHPRMAGIEDCRTAYRWLLENGPTGRETASAMFVAGDSAGGNLTLSLIAWIRDEGLRAPNAAVALSPATDSTLGSPSLKGNLPTDPMLGPLFKTLTKIPRSILIWVGWLQNRMPPNHPVISPVYGDLKGLPPVLIHVSEAEMLRDDSRRYVNRAMEAGSPVTLQSWNHMVHVWHLYHPILPEGREAFDEIEKFLRARS